MNNAEPWNGWAMLSFVIAVMLGSLVAFIAFIANALVVPCGDSEVSPAVNTGTPYTG
jgi:hypothetical protein